jgi:hypothetical protein
MTVSQSKKANFHFLFTNLYFLIIIPKIPEVFLCNLHGDSTVSAPKQARRGFPAQNKDRRAARVFRLSLRGGRLFFM